MAFPENEKQWNEFLSDPNFTAWPPGMKRPTIEEYNIANKRFKKAQPEYRKNMMLTSEMQGIGGYYWLRFFYPEQSGQ